MAPPPPQTAGNAPLFSRRNQIIVITVVVCFYLTSLTKDNPQGQQEMDSVNSNLRLRENNMHTSQFTTTTKEKHRNSGEQNGVEKGKSRQPIDASHADEKVVVAVHKSDGQTWPSINREMLEETGRHFPMTPSLPAAYKDPPVELRGQITLQTTFGAKLNELARQEDVRLVLEIGTWFGGGSSWCLGQALRDTLTDREKPDKWMFTVEMFQPAHDYAASTLANLPITCVRAGTVGKAGYLRPEEIPDNEKNEHYNLYYERDIQLADTAPAVLQTMCTTYDFDLVLLDGNEYTGYAEFLVVRDVCKPKYLALHDCGTLKTRKVQEYLDGDGKVHWKKLASNSDAAAWAVYEAL